MIDDVFYERPLILCILLCTSFNLYNKKLRIERLKKTIVVNLFELISNLISNFMMTRVGYNFNDADWLGYGHVPVFKLGEL